MPSDGGWPMSALGQKQTFAPQKAMSALHPITTAKAKFRKRPCLLYPQERTFEAAGRLGPTRKRLNRGVRGTATFKRICPRVICCCIASAVGRKSDTAHARLAAAPGLDFPPQSNRSVQFLQRRDERSALSASA